MDGTLTVPAIDFAEMRRRLGIHRGDILTTVRAWPAERQRAAFATIEEIEERARLDLAVQPGARELLAHLDSRGIHKGIITRNTMRAVRHLVDRLGVSFSPVVTRDFLPVKPDPAPVAHICAAWRVEPGHVLMVGDYRDDILCGKAGGTRTCLLKNDRNAEFVGLADFDVESLHELLDVVASLSA